MKDTGGRTMTKENKRQVRSEKTVTSAIALKLINERSERNGLLTSHVSLLTL